MDMVKRLIMVLVVVLSVLALVACDKQTDVEQVTMTLDWVPNTNHTGLYVALDKGWYLEEGIDLDIQVPADPAGALKQVAVGQTEFGVSFQEEVTIARSTGIPVVSIAAVIQHNTSALVSRGDSDIQSAADFEGKTYASYGLPLEYPLIKGLMACEGADVEQLEFIDVGWDIFPALIGGKVDLAWIYMAWDGVHADLMGEDLNVIPFYGSCVPDYYTPVIVAGESTLTERGDLVKAFMAATVRGYEWAIAHPADAAEILLKYSPESDPELVRASQAWLSPRYQDDAGQWGVQDPAVWDTFTTWMDENGLLDESITATDAFTNEFLP